MTDKQETVADVVGEMRRRAAAICKAQAPYRGTYVDGLGDAELDGYCNAIESALARDKAALLEVAEGVDGNINVDGRVVASRIRKIAEGM